MSAKRFLQQATLKWGGDRCWAATNVAWGQGAVRRNGEGPRLDPSRLGGENPYRRRPRDANCRPQGTTSYDTLQRTRPYDQGIRPAGLAAGEGFYLDLLTEAYDGDRRVARRQGQLIVRDTPTYFERDPTRVAGRPGLRLTYWTLYGSSRLQGSDPRRTVASHEGDWERVEVLLRSERGRNRYLPVAVRLHGNGEIRRVAWRDIERVGDDGAQAVGATHPVIYAGRDGHTPYTQPGRYAHRVSEDGKTSTGRDEAGEACSDCPQWRTWASLRNARTEPWYGFGGGWGLAHQQDATSGQLGPSPHSSPSAVRRTQAVASVRALQQAFQDGDPVAICKLMTKAARRQAGLMAHGEPGRCSQDLREAFGAIGSGGGWGKRGVPAIAAIRESGPTRMTVTARQGREWRAQVPLVLAAGKWKLDAFFGIPAPQARRHAAAIEDARHPSRQGGPVLVRDEDGRACEPLSAASYPRVGASCHMRFNGADVEFPVLTPFGDFRFVDCRIDYRVLVDAVGRTWTTSFIALDRPTGTGQGCSDIEPCEDRADEDFPWRGRFGAAPDGTFVHRVDVCLNTCVGYFVGEMTTRLKRHGSRWRTTSEPSDVGASGLRLTTPLEVDMSRAALAADQPR